MEVYDSEEYESGENDFKTLRISDSKDHSTIVLDNISTLSEKEEELTRDQSEKWVPVKKPKSNEKSQKGPKIIHERSVSWEDVDLTEKETDDPDKCSKMKKYFKIIGAVLLVLGTLIGAILCMVYFFGSGNQPILGATFGPVISGKVKLRKVKLNIRADGWFESCGGENLYIEITHSGNKTCQTERKESFEPDWPISWTEKGKNKLGGCKDIEFDAKDDTIDFKIKTDDGGDDFCPKKLTFTMNNGVLLIKDNMKKWDEKHEGVATKVVE